MLMCRPTGCLRPIKGKHLERAGFYSESLSKSAKVTKALLPLSFGGSPRLAVPSLRSCSVGPPPSAIHGRRRLTRHSCRVAHCAEPPLGLSRGRLPQKHLEAAYRSTCLFKRTHSPVGASRLAPTGSTPLWLWLLILLWLWLWLWLLILICPVGRPSAGSAQWAPRQGCRGSRPRPWMADGGGPTEQDRSEGMPSLGEAPDVRGQSVLVTLALFQSDPP